MIEMLIWVGFIIAIVGFVAFFQGDKDYTGYASEEVKPKSETDDFGAGGNP